MQILTLFFLSVLSFSWPAQINTSGARRAEDHVVIQRRRIVLVRNHELAKRFPDRKTAVVTYPVISGLNNPVVLQRVRFTLDFKNIFDYSLDDYRKDSWLSEFTYKLNYNSNYILDITFTQSGMAAYPDEQDRHFLIDLRDGHILKALDVFESNGLKSLASLVDLELQREIKQIAKENAAEPEEKEAVAGAYENLKLGVQNLDDFSVGRTGITFLYNAGFPHVIKALEPRGHYFFSYSALNQYIKRDGLLGRFKG
jgi:hypothetical protein